MTNETWGFDMEGVEPEEAFPTLPVGTYTFEVVEITSKRDKNNNPFLHPKLEVVDADDDQNIGRSYMPYLSLAEDRVGRTKHMLMQMGAPKAAFSNNNGPRAVVGCVFKADLVKSGNWMNLRNIESQIEPEEEEKPKEEAAVPPPRRRRSSRPSSR